METQTSTTQKTPLIDGPIRPGFIAEQIDRTGRHKDQVGGYDLFLGQVRADQHKGKPVQAIEYTAYDKMATECIERIQDIIITQYPVKKVAIFHSKGIVKAGEISLFVLVTARHRKRLFEAVKAAVAQVKAEVPIWKRELFTDNHYRWKT